MTKAAITPGNQPIQVNTNTMKKDPHPLSITANGGQKRQITARTIPIFFSYMNNTIYFSNREGIHETDSFYVDRIDEPSIRSLEYSITDFVSQNSRYFVSLWIRVENM